MHGMKTSFPYRFAAIDIDDTLVGEDKSVSRENTDAITLLRERGVHVVLASGRSHENILTFHRQLGLSGYIISAQGALTRHAESGKVLHEGPLNPSDAIRAIVAGQAHDLTILAYGRGRIYADRVGKWAQVHEEEIRHTEPVHQAELTELADEGLLKVIWAGEPEQIAKVYPQAHRDFGKDMELAITCPYYLEFNSRGINKAAGIQAITHTLNIAQHEVLAFGDGNNDVAMLAWAGMGVAMDTGRPAARRAAKRTSPPGDPRTALARAIHQLFDEAGPRQAA
jgi:Cof subfamily protein (haloacid dehalogenase superfamily)